MARSLTKAILVMTILLLATPRAFAQVMSRDQILDQQKKQRGDTFKSMKNTVANMQPLGAKTLDDVFQLRMEGKRLVLNSPITEKQKQGQYRVQVDPFAGPTYITVSQIGVFRNRVGVAAKPGNIERQQRVMFLSYELTPENDLTTTIVQWHPGQFSVERNTQMTEGNRMVRLMESQEGGEPVVQLFVSQYGASLGPPRSTNATAADFHTLMRENPREAEEFLRPLMRSLGQESVFAPDFVIAWQVFSDRWKPDEALGRKIEAMLPKLDDPDFHVRERVVGELEDLGEAGAAVLLNLERGDFPAQRNLLIDRALARYLQLSPREAGRLRNDRTFLLDCLYSDKREVRVAAFDRLLKLVADDHGPLTFDLDANPPARSKAIQPLRDKLLEKPPSLAP